MKFCRKKKPQKENFPTFHDFTIASRIKNDDCEWQQKLYVLKKERESFCGNQMKENCFATFFIFFPLSLFRHFKRQTFVVEKKLFEVKGNEVISILLSYFFIPALHFALVD